LDCYVLLHFKQFLSHDAMQARPMPSCSVRVSLCVTVTFVHSVKMNKRIFEIFAPSGSQAILIFLYQTG